MEGKHGGREKAGFGYGHTEGARPGIDDTNGVGKTFEEVKIGSETIFHMFRLKNKH